MSPDISIKVLGNPNSNGGEQTIYMKGADAQPLVLKGSRYSGFYNCSYLSSIVIDDNKVLYKLIKNNVSSYGDHREGVLHIAFSIPQGCRLANGKTPYDVLCRLRDLFLEKGMTKGSSMGREIYNYASPSTPFYQTILDEAFREFPLERTRIKYKPMCKEGVIGLIREPEERIKELFRDIRYPEFSQYKEILIAESCDSQRYMPINIIIPRPAAYTVIVDNVPQPRKFSRYDTIDVWPRKNERYYRIDKHVFTVDQLINGTRINGVDFDDELEEVRVNTTDWVREKELKIKVNVSIENGESGETEGLIGDLQFKLGNNGEQCIFERINRTISLLGEKIKYFDDKKIEVSLKEDTSSSKKYDLTTQFLSASGVTSGSGTNTNMNVDQQLRANSVPATPSSQIFSGTAKSSTIGYGPNINSNKYPAWDGYTVSPSGSSVDFNANGSQGSSDYRGGGKTFGATTVAAPVNRADVPTNTGENANTDELRITLKEKEAVVGVYFPSSNVNLDRTTYNDVQRVEDLEFCAGHKISPENGKLKLKGEEVWYFEQGKIEISIKKDARTDIKYYEIDGNPRFNHTPDKRIEINLKEREENIPVEVVLPSSDGRDQEKLKTQVLRDLEFKVGNNYGEPLKCDNDQITLKGKEIDDFERIRVSIKPETNTFNDYELVGEAPQRRDDKKLEVKLRRKYIPSNYTKKDLNSQRVKENEGGVGDRNKESQHSGENRGSIQRSAKKSSIFHTNLSNGSLLKGFLIALIVILIIAFTLFFRVFLMNKNDNDEAQQRKSSEQKSEWLVEVNSKLKDYRGDFCWIEESVYTEFCSDSNSYMDIDSKIGDQHDEKGNIRYGMICPRIKGYHNLVVAIQEADTATVFRLIQHQDSSHIWEATFKDWKETLNSSDEAKDCFVKICKDLKSFDEIDGRLKDEIKRKQDEKERKSIEELKSWLKDINEIIHRPNVTFAEIIDAYNKYTKDEDNYKKADAETEDEYNPGKMGKIVPRIEGHYNLVKAIQEADFETIFKMADDPNGYHVWRKFFDSGWVDLLKGEDAEVAKKAFEKNCKKFKTFADIAPKLQEAIDKKNK